MALERFRSSIGVARLVMERSQHAMLCGVGALEFARSIGLSPAKSNSEVLTAHAWTRYNEMLNRKTLDISNQQTFHSDTVGIICLDKFRQLCAGSATSGMPFKENGRVGDSPIIGAGLFADCDVGAAVATGDGDQMIKHCMSFAVVEHMRNGFSVSDACAKVVERVLQKDGANCQAAMVAMSKDGEIGAASTHNSFSLVKWNAAAKGVPTSPALAMEQVAGICL